MSANTSRPSLRCLISSIFIRPSNDERGCAEATASQAITSGIPAQTASYSDLCRRRCDCRLRHITCERAGFKQMIENACGTLLNGFHRAIHYDVCGERLFVRIADASEVFDFAGERLLIKSFHIAFDQHGKRGAHENFDKARAVAFDRLANIITRLPV